jgi:Flp pilus assembly protein CpaB
VPAVPLDTLRVIVQLPLAGIVPLASAAEPVADDTEPLHVLVAAGEVATLSPLGNASVSATWVKG